MLWPIVLPFQITFCSLAGLVALVTMLSPALKWKRGKTFIVSTIIACVAFIPSCTGIMKVIDANRFGVFEHGAFADVKDFRIERYLPTKSQNITVAKFVQGHRAKYTISELELMEYLDGLWNEYGEHSTIRRDELDEGASATDEDFQRVYGDLGWPPFASAVKYHSPVQSDGGGATYYFDRNAGIAYHRAGYW